MPRYLFVLACCATVAALRCSPSSNISCPDNAYGCIKETLGLGWACNVSSTDPSHPFTACFTGAPSPLSKTKKNVLIIGDSVSNGYVIECGGVGCVPELLEDVALVQHAPWSPGSGGAGPTQHGVDCLDLWLRQCDGTPARYDLISLNFGLHNLRNDTASLTQYSSQLESITARLRSLAPATKLLYVTTTPMMPTCCRGGPLVPAGEGAPTPECGANDTQNFYPCNTVVQELNVMAQRIMERHSVEVVDAYSTVTGMCGNEYKTCSFCRKTPCSFHYTPAGYQHIAQPIAAAMRAMLNSG